jgi:hypothetical protein
VEDNGTLYIEGEIDGNTARYELANGCIPAYSVGFAHLDICVSNIDVQAGTLRSLTLTVKVCVGADIGPIHLGQCWDLFNQEIHFHNFSAGEVADLVGVESASLRADDWTNAKFVTHSKATVVDDRVTCCTCHS